MIDSWRLINPSPMVQSGGAFSPLSISGLIAWYDPSDPSTLFQDTAFSVGAGATNDPVGCWRDKSPSANHVSQATANRRPLLKLSGQNGLPTLSFDGANDLLVATSSFVSGLPGITLFVVAKVTSTGTFATLAGTEVVAKLFKTSTNQLAGYSSSNGTGWTSQANGTTLDTAWHVIGFVSGSTETYLRRDMADNGSRLGSGPTPLGSNSNVFSLFGRTAGENTAGELAEVLVYSRALGGTQVTQVEAYLRAKWGV